MYCRAVVSPVSSSPCLHALARADAVSPLARIAPATRPPLVAAEVPGRVDFFERSSPASDPAAIAMYARPSDRNAAATAVLAGRLIDVEG